MNAIASLPPFDRVTGPRRVENLDLYLVHGPDRCPDSFITLSEALDAKLGVVHETGEVRELEIENLSPDRDLFILAGEVVKGGRQDRTMGMDLVVPARSPRAKVPAFCVERRRWARRGAEDAGSFSGSSTMIAKELLMKVKWEKCQMDVWEAVDAAQNSLSNSLGANVASMASPSSYPLMMEDDRVRSRQALLQQELGAWMESQRDVIGFAFVINGRPSTADVFASSRLARSFSRKLLDAAIVTALVEGDRRRPANDEGPELGADEVSRWLAAALDQRPSEVMDVPPRLRVEQGDYDAPRRTAFFASHDHGHGVCLHRSWTTL